MFVKVLLLFVPLTIALDWAKYDPLLVFACSCCAIVPLANLLAKSTEALAEMLGPTIGGLLNATLGNAPELIIGGLALSKGLTNVVKSSISGSILMNLLLLLGIAMVTGGAKRISQKFNRTSAGMSSALLTLASIGLVVPALAHLSTPNQQRELSLEISIVLVTMYVLSLVFTLLTHKQLFSKTEVVSTQSVHDEKHEPAPKAGMLGVVGSLTLTAVFLAIISEIMTDSLDPAIKVLGFSETFAGIIILGSLGNIAQLFAAVRFARADNMDLAMGTTVGAATQAALAVAPLLVFTSRILGQPMDLLFTPFEIVALGLAVLVTGQFTRDGESNWMEGAMLIGVYVIFAIGFYFSGN